MKKWTLIQSGSKVYLRFINPEEEGALAFLQPDRTSYKVEGCRDVLQSAREVVLQLHEGQKMTHKMMGFIMCLGKTVKVEAI